MKRKMTTKLLFSITAIFCIALTACQKKTPSESSGDISSDISGDSSSEPSYSITRPEYTPEYNDYSIGPAPTGVNMTYYTDIYSRGFSWITDASVDNTDFYLVESDKGKDADFSTAELKAGETKKVTFETSGNVKFADDSYPAYKGSSNSSEQVANIHKVHVENLKKGQAYSYKLGSESGWTYGAFIVEKEAPQTITAIHMSDAQTKDPSKLNVWRNTFTNAVTTAGQDLDMVLYNGDQFDQNMEKINNVRPLRFNMYSKAYDVIQDYKFNLPYMASSGNHEPSAPYSQFLHADISYPDGGVSATGAYYSYDYQYAHFTVLNTNDISTAQINWLKDDLDKASNAKWKVVMMHISPYSTGDHSNKSENQSIVEKLTPIFSSKHVDLVLQAHDHTYNKTMPYKWDAAGYTTTWNNQDVVNLNPETETKDNISYDKNPQGTYYVTTGAAGHRCGASESDGVWAEVVKDNDTYKGLDSSKTFLDNKYKIELGKIKYNNQYESYKVGSFTSTQNYQVGDLATGNVNAQMFGVLNLSESTLSYNVYTVNSATVKLFDSLDILKA